MQKRFHRRKIIFKKTKWNLFVLTLFLLGMALFLSFKIINTKVTPVLLTYAESKATKIATLLITQAVNDKVLNMMDVEDIVITSKDDGGFVREVDVNPISVNKLLNQITNYVQEYLEKVEAGNIDSLGVSDTIFSNYDLHKLKQGIIYEIPSGVVFKNSLLSNLGPKIPVRINLVGDVTSDIQTKVSNYGINNVFLEVIVYVEVSMQVLLPFASKTVQANTSIPIVMKIIEGSVPNFYYPSLTNKTAE
jgi:sporulation protein YunB